jgi:putative flippase GtrA
VEHQGGTPSKTGPRPEPPAVAPASAPRSLLGAPLADHAARGSAFLLGATSAALTFLAYLLLTTGWSLPGRTVAPGLAIEVHLASALAWETGILWSFAGHSLLTFRTLRTTRGLGHRFLRFHAVALVGLGVSQAAFAFFHDLLRLASPWPMVLAIPVATPFNYLAQRYWTWGDPAAAREGAP